MAVGKIVTGFSKPYVALYSASGTTITYTSGQLLSQGVDVSASATTADDNDFYADNIVSESEAGVFTSGDLSLTVKGLEQSAEQLIMGLPAANSDGFIVYDDDQAVPDVGVGFVVRYMQDGVTTYTPVIYPRCTFQTPATDAATQGETIDWQTQALTATIKRADDAKRSWKYVGGALATEASAEDKIKAFFSISSATT